MPLSPRPSSLGHSAIAATLALLLLSPTSAAQLWSQEPTPPPTSATTATAEAQRTSEDGETTQRAPRRLIAPGERLADPGLYLESLEAAQQAADFYGLWDDEEQQLRVQEIGYRLAQETGYGDYPFTFHLIDMPVPNAFALPGGQIFIARSMLQLGLDDDMLANLLGHEIAHVTHEHGIKMQKRARLVNLLSQALILGAMVGANSDDGNPVSPYDRNGRRQGSQRGELVQGTAAVSLVLGQLLLLDYSREFEDESDDEGQRLAAAAGFDPDGARRLWQLMTERVPQENSYGYWRTHPFDDDRLRNAEERAQYLKIQQDTEVAEYRQRSQRSLLAQIPTLEEEQEELKYWLEASALAAWPVGPDAERLRLAKLARLRTAEEEKQLYSRDYGALAAAFRKELDEVESLSPASPFLDQLGQRLAALEAERRRLYPEVRELILDGAPETSVLQAFLSNYPDAPEAAAVALDLGNAFSRLSQPAQAVEHYLLAWRLEPGGESGERAQLGLRNLTPYLEDLRALGDLAAVEEDPELSSLASDRLAAIADDYKQLANGAAYLEHFPESSIAETVRTRLHKLADGLYTEITLYQGVGDHAKALDRIQEILTHAPLSPAAASLQRSTRERSQEA
ncbi:MAG: M48 family metalloprotease [Acidobacteriota bacterium]